MTRVLTKAPADYYIWRPPGGQAEVHIRFDVVDAMNIEVMKGFGAVRKRGAEVGGILLGHLDLSSGRPIAVIDSFQPVPCEYAYGPSYILSDNDLPGLRAALEEFDDVKGREQYAVGLFRSHTRDGFALDAYDVEMFSHNFSDHNVFLLIKPYATKAAEAGFFLRTDGQINADKTDLPFAFRRRELGGAESSAPTPNQSAKPRGAAEPKGSPEEREARLKAGVFPERPPASQAASADESLDKVEVGERSHRSAYSFDAAGAQAPQSGPKTSWATRIGWILVSLMLLAFAVLAGARYGPSLIPGLMKTDRDDPYQLNLSATRTNDSVMVRWDRGCAAVKTAKRGLLTISEGTDARSVNLDAAQLGTGLVLYRHVAPEITFKLEVSVGEHSAVVESLVWHEAKPVAN